MLLANEDAIVSLWDNGMPLIIVIYLIYVALYVSIVRYIYKYTTIKN